jgi:hypothetical protein
VTLRDATTDVVVCDTTRGRHRAEGVASALAPRFVSDFITDFPPTTLLDATRLTAAHPFRIQGVLPPAMVALTTAATQRLCGRVSYPRGALTSGSIFSCSLFSWARELRLGLTIVWGTVAVPFWAGPSSRPRLRKAPTPDGGATLRTDGCERAWMDGSPSSGPRSTGSRSDRGGDAARATAAPAGHSMVAPAFLIPGFVFFSLEGASARDAGRRTAGRQASSERGLASEKQGDRKNSRHVSRFVRRAGDAALAGRQMCP